MSELAGINETNVRAWLGDHVDDIADPVSYELIAGGHSNLTFRVSDAEGRSWVLRRPPLFQVLATAHDMTREYKVIDALYPSAVPVPRPVGLCTDESVNDRPFYVMDFVAGHIVREAEVAEATTLEFRQAASRSLISTLAQIHAVDVDEVGLGDLGKKEDYVGRQLRRWHRQFHDSKTTERPAFDEIHEFLVANIPDQGPAGIVHGDFRLDNCMMRDDGSVAAVLDWELCTLGDVMCDLSGLLIYWTEPDDAFQSLSDSPTAVGGFMSRQELIELYEQESGRSMDNIDYYMAFSAWRLASILEGVYSRYVNGAMGDKDAGDVEEFVVRINAMLDLAQSHLAALTGGETGS